VADLTLRQRFRIAALAADRSRRSTIAGMLSSPLMRWQFRPTAANQLLIVPQDLRTADPSFWSEIEHGQFGLAGTIAHLHGRSPFDINPPNVNWARELHGFGWLRDLRAAGSNEARDAARRLAAEWAIRSHDPAGVSTEAAVAARRLISWLSSADLLLEEADESTYRTITTSLGLQLALLGAGWRDAPYGVPRLLSLVALTLASLTIAGQERALKGVEQALSAELDYQVLADGGHISRNPMVLVELMLDLLPLNQCYATRSRKPPAALPEAMDRVFPMLRHLRMGDGMLARFNGVGAPSATGLATILVYHDPTGNGLADAPASHYSRLERGRAIVIVDAGSPPPLEISGEAQAGCLSFEMSSGPDLLFVNSGMPGAGAANWRPAARATASHNTLCLAEQSSSRLVANQRLETLIGSPPIRTPDNVRSRMGQTDDTVWLDASHDGYLSRFELVHNRRLSLASDGGRLEGVDRLDGFKRKVRLRRDLPFAIHFHLHPDVSCRLSKDRNSAELELLDGESWNFGAEGAEMTIEESVYFADIAGPRRALQIVLRGATFGESEIKWFVERLNPEKAE